MLLVVFSARVRGRQDSALTVNSFSKTTLSIAGAKSPFVRNRRKTTDRVRPHTNQCVKFSRITRENHASQKL